ncbi:MAG: hypothetical protein HY904_13635 [Deltaproteobacteria bacterium]|nr:hypothetical protein [Deltaproteobacteria bacterium]
MACVRARLSAVAVLLLAAGGTRADELGDLLSGGPLVRVEHGEDNRFRRALCLADVDAPVEVVWAVIAEPSRYKEFMPRVKRITVVDEGPNQKLVSYLLDTPFSDTAYTLRFKLDPVARTIDARHVSGDIRGSEYAWKLTAQGPETTRIHYGGVTRNYSSVAQRFEDDSQTVTVGVNVVGLMAAVKAVKSRSEATWKKQKAAGATVRAAGDGGVP